MFGKTDNGYDSVYDRFYFADAAALRKTGWFKAAFVQIVSVFRRTAKRWAEARRINHTIRELSALSDEQLNDIGLSRGAIPRAALQASSLDFIRYNRDR